MAKCDLSIELDEPDAIYPGGGKITGTVHVRADADVNCNALEVKTAWATHGRGNVAKADVASIVLYEGAWRSGEENSYRFELPIAEWPPTYHGFHLNVDHRVDARAKISWAFDPKASTTFAVRPTTVDPKNAGSNVVELKGPMLMVFVAVFSFVSFGVVFAMSMKFGPLAWLFLIAPMLLVAGLVLYTWLPKWVLGDVKCEFVSDTVSPGQAIVGELVLQPNKMVSIAGASAELVGSERCVSGSGSNTTTHRHTFHSETQKLTDATKLSPGQPQRFPIEFRLPADAPLSINLTSNTLSWVVNVRVQLASWPDWKKSTKIEVVPSADGVIAAVPMATHVEVPESAAAEDGGITFDETVRHLWAVKDDRETTDELVSAVSGMTFDIAATIQRRLLYAGDEDANVYPGGFAVWATAVDPPLGLVLYVPKHLGDEFEQAGGAVWRGRGTIVGWDHRHGRLQVRL